MTVLEPARPAIDRTKRYRHVLVPLDGSEAAEVALADAASVSMLNGARLTLLRAVPAALEAIDTGAEAIAIDQQEAVRRGGAQRYLDSVCRSLAPAGVEARVAVEVGEAAEAILDYADQHSVDLIVMATHGRSGWRRWVLGSIAEKVLRAAAQPVLLVRVPRAGHDAAPMEDPSCAESGGSERK